MSDIGQTFSRMFGEGSLHKDDWLNVGLMLGTAALGGGALIPEAAAATAAGEGAGWAVGAGESLGGGLGASFGMGDAAAGLGAGFDFGLGAMEGTGSELLGEGFDYGLGAMEGTGTMSPESALLNIKPTSAEASLYSPEGLADPKRALNESRRIGMTGKQAEFLGKMISQGSGGEQRPQGAPQMSNDPNVRSQLLTQEQITKKWLQQNDPNTYARMYGQAG